MSTRNYIRLIWTKIKLAQQNNTNFHQNPLNSFIDGSCGWRGITSLLWVFFVYFAQSRRKNPVYDMPDTICYMACLQIPQ